MTFLKGPKNRHTVCRHNQAKVCKGSKPDIVYRCDTVLVNRIFKSLLPNMLEMKNLQSFATSKTSLQVIGSSRPAFPMSFCNLSFKKSLSSSFSHLEFSGNPGMTKYHKSPMKAVQDPSIMKTHLQPLYPLSPCKFPIPLAINPPKAPASVVLQKKNENRFWASARLYHEPMR